MAESIKGPAPKKRGRPSKAEIEQRKANERSAQAAIDSKEKGKAAPASNGDPAETAPAFGHNRANEGLFLRHVQVMRAQDAKIEEAKALVKVARGQLKDLRNLAKADGIVLRELDEALEELETERVDLLARQERLQLYREWLGLPTLRSADKVEVEKDPAARWSHMGNVAGRLGKNREIPDSCPPEHVQDWLHGWDKGQEALMRESPLTRDAFKDTAGSAAAAPETPPPGAPVVQAPERDPAPGGLVAFAEHHFETGTSLDDCNFKTLLEEHRPKWTAADNVIVVIGGKKRVLKEPGYEDTGEADVDISEPEDAGDVALEILEADVDQRLGDGAVTVEDLAEVEPEIAAQVEADHGEGAGLTEEGEVPIEADDAASDGEEFA